MMRTKAAIFASGMLVLGAVVSIGNNGCGDDEDENATGASRKGEACQTTGDCVAGLACIPNAAGTGICVLGAFSVQQTAKECAVIECREASDCCGPPPASCDALLQNCLAQADAGTPPPHSLCLQYEATCKCDESRRGCESNKCITKCERDEQCTTSGAGRICAGGRCVQCGSDTDCTAGGNSTLRCVSGQCKPPCEGDGDCPGFERCREGQCTEGACETDRECVAATGNVEATCGTDGKCISPCTTDLECGNPKSYKFFSCVGGQCLYLGCGTDKDCRLMLRGANESSSSSSSSSSGSSGSIFTTQQHIVCRDKDTPGTTTLPAR